MISPKLVSAAGRGRGHSRREARRDLRLPGAAQHAPEPRANRLDRRRADDRPRARHLRRRARERDEGVEPRRDRGPGQGRFVVTSQDGFIPFVRRAGDAAAEARGVELATSVRSELGKVAGTDKYVTGSSPTRSRRSTTSTGPRARTRLLATLGEDGAILDKGFAEDENLAVGDRFELLTGIGRTATLTVKAIYEPPPFYPLLGVGQHPQGQVRLASTTGRATSSRS